MENSGNTVPAINSQISVKIWPLYCSGRCPRMTLMQIRYCVLKNQRTAQNNNGTQKFDAPAQVSLCTEVDRTDFQRSLQTQKISCVFMMKSTRMCCM